MTEGVELGIREGSGDEVEGEVEVRLSLLEGLPVFGSTVQIRTREK